MYADREAAGVLLAERLRELELRSPVVYGIARGGVVVAAAVAAGLGCPLEVLVPRKIPAPYHAEVAIGAVTEDGVVLLDQQLASTCRAGADYLEVTIAQVRQEIGRRAASYRGGNPPLPPLDRDAILVDDGIATGYTAAAAARGLRTGQPRQLVLAVPVGSAEGLDWLGQEVDQVVCPSQPARFYAVSQAYRQFDQTGDAEVIALLARHRAGGSA